MSTKYSYDKKSLLRDGMRWFPVMGEIHYSRYPEQYWKEALLRMKEGGVDIVSSYVIWIHHEEVENEWNFSGCRDLRKFVTEIGNCGLTMILRVGPWSHAEVRNGGFPDWLLAKCPAARTNDESYFTEVQKFYAKIFEQVDGLLLKDGGPIIGLQIENEYGHCGGLTGTEGEAHMKRLLKIARDVGFDVPLYTATGWGGAVTAGMLPVMGGYCDAPWDPRITEIEPSGNFVFTYERNDHAIGSDFGLGEGITFDMTKYPYLTAELGGGLQVTYKRRPVAKPADIGAMSLSKMGSGCNLLGYYMYHGGTNPEGKLTTLEENTATGSINDLPVKNYDFRAPLGEYGMPNGTYDEIKLDALFVHDFGEKLCEMNAHIPQSNPVHPENNKTLRSSWRFAEESEGFVFVNNYQRCRKMAEHPNTVLSRTKADGSEIKFAPVDVRDGDFYFLPFGMKIGKNILQTSLATPLCKLNNGRKSFVFYSAACPSGKSPAQNSFVTSIEDADRTLYDFGTAAEDDVDIVTLSREDALKSHKIRTSDGIEHILVTDSVVYCEKNADETELHFVSDRKISFRIFPSLAAVPEGFVLAGCEKGFALYESSAPVSKAPEVSVKELAVAGGTAKYSVVTGDWSASGACDVMLEVAYTGNCARLYENERLVDDSIFIGESYPWTIGLKRFGVKKNSFVLEVDELKKDAPVYLEQWPEFSSNGIMKVSSIKARAYHEVTARI